MHVCNISIFITSGPDIHEMTRCVKSVPIKPILSFISVFVIAGFLSLVTYITLNLLLIVEFDKFKRMSTLYDTLMELLIYKITNYIIH